MSNSTPGSPQVMSKIQKKNISDIQHYLLRGLSIEEAEKELQEVLHETFKSGGISDEAASQLATTQAREAINFVKVLQAQIYNERDPRTAVDPKTAKERWYTGPQEGDYLWPRYRKKLLEEKNLPQETVAGIDDQTNRITRHLGSPGSPKFRKQGLVVGRVQSGKTSNFMGLLAKAGDAGYRMIIVLAGTTNTLRYQTQERLQNDLLDHRDTKWRWLTKAEIIPGTQLRVDPAGEFHEMGTAASTVSNNSVRVIAVIKKNVSVLKRLRRWLTVPESQMANCPVLIVDDECDNASVNTRNPEVNPSSINGEIRDILALIPKVSYVGYTATPFANVLSNPRKEDEDLYPRNFLFALPLNPEYFGPERIFGRESDDANDPGSDGNDIVRTISEPEISMVTPASRNTLSTFNFEAPPSLINAVRYFLMNSAARIVREKSLGMRNEFKSMLINTAQFMKVHREALPKIKEVKEKLLKELMSKPAVWEKQWEEESEKVSQNQIGCVHAKVKWSDLNKELTPEFFEKVKVIVSNSSPNEASNLNAEYNESNRGTVLIVIGGNTLSRGITLEGLTVSYFVRNCAAYDTLLQMGRWFGYRKNYEDMPRVWMTATMEDQFVRLSGVEKDMFGELESFMAGKSPEEVGLRIRQSPGMLITARNKMIHARTCNLNYTGHMENTTYLFRTNKIELEKNLDATKELIQACGGPQNFEARSQFKLTRNVDIQHILKFINKYSIHPKNEKFDREIILKYLKIQNKDSKCLKWNIAIKTRNDNDNTGYEIAGLSINRLQLPRSNIKAYEKESFAYIQNLSTKEDIFADADDPVAREIEAKTQKLERKAVRRKYENGTGLIVLYPINKDSAKGDSNTRLDMNAADDLIGMAIYFPQVQNDNRIHDYVSVEIIPPPEPVIEDEDELENPE